jgi:hypothetical protein
MKRTILHSILLICALGFSQIAVADRPVNDATVSGAVESFNAKHRQISVDDTIYQLSPYARIVDASGRSVSDHALRRGTKVKFSPVPNTPYGELPVIMEIQILPHAQ